MPNKRVHISSGNNPTGPEKMNPTIGTGSPIAEALPQVSQSARSFTVAGAGKPLRHHIDPILN